MRALILGLVLSLAAGAASAEVVESREDGFRLRSVVTVASADRAAAWAALGQVAAWWDGEHTYSGDAANLSLPLEAGACFCERLTGGGVAHGRVLLAWPEQGLLRLDAPLGPLQGEGVAAVLTFQVRTLETGGVEIVQTFNVGGAGASMVGAAPLIDQVMSHQLARLGRYLETGAPD